MIPEISISHLVIVVYVHILSNFVCEVTCLKAPSPSPPTAAVYLLEDESEKKMLLTDIINSDVEIPPGRSARLECYANNPVQWSYRGIGRPQFTTNITVDELNDKEIYKASLQLRGDEQDTGSYFCSYTEFPKISSSFHLFIPGTDLFVSDVGRKIGYSAKNALSVLIPCPVTIKNAKVILRKVYYDGSLRTIDAKIAAFDPKVGFNLNIRDLRDSEGVYICAGYVGGAIKLREYVLRNEDRNQTIVTYPDGHHEDVNPCLSYFCPSRSVCRVNLNTHLPFCACRKGTSSSITNCTRLCKTSQECPKAEKCQFSIEKQLKMCVPVCDDHVCPAHAVCYVDVDVPKCRCNKGFQGDGNDLCERIPLKPEADDNSYCSQAKCGPNARCHSVNGRSQCTCSIGTLGTYPNCSRACIVDEDCDFQDKCTEKGICEHVCNENMCAPKAECKVLHRRAQCVCPPGYTGKATEACYPSHYYFSSRSGVAASDNLEDTTINEFYGEHIPTQAAFDEEEESLKLSLPTD